MDKEVIYWDACCCLKWINQEKGCEKLKGLLDKAKKGEIEIRTSALSYVEVFLNKDKERVDEAKSFEIPKFFKEHYVVIINIDLPISKLARLIYFNYKIDQNTDAVHLASAVFDGISVFHTYNEHLLKKDKMIVDPLNPYTVPLRIIVPPDYYIQESLLET